MKNSHTRQLWIILTIVFFGFVGLSMPYLIFPSLFLSPEYAIVPEEWDLGTRGLWLGVTLAAYPFGQFLGLPILGALSDEYGRRQILAGSLVVAAASNVLSAFSVMEGVLWLLILSRFIAGFMEGNIAIARALAADIKEFSKNMTFGKINAAASIAYLVGPLLGGVLSDQTISSAFSFSMPFFLMCGLFIFLALLTSIALKEKIRIAEDDKRSFWDRIDLSHRLAVLFKNPRLRFLLIVATTFTVAVDIFYEFIPVYLTANWQLTPAQLAIYNSVLCISLAIGSGWLVVKLAAGYHPKKIINAAILFFSAILYGMVLIDRASLMLLSFFAIGFCISFATTLLAVKISDSASETSQGEVMGVMTSLRVLGDALICLLGGVMMVLSIKGVLVLASTISLLSLLYYRSSKNFSTQVEG